MISAFMSKLFFVFAVKYIGDFICDENSIVFCLFLDPVFPSTLLHGPVIGIDFLRFKPMILVFKNKYIMAKRNMCVN